MVESHEPKHGDDMPIEQIPRAGSPVEHFSVKPKGTETSPDASSISSADGRAHGAVEVVPRGHGEEELAIHEPVREKKRFSYLRSKEFWIVLALRYTDPSSIRAITY